ncbi:hypothetical protein PR202_gb20275 [Eleusine coracana subsp. coracana]|uniref:Reverse transcriptase zinc-binding domain-containing protein n=1 Tax=Eleusine coracana subsp. coracana TaxID=191504 RepID=A0AAV5F840_ELECO|nr:hypothetical protein PR202_gb20275 [Eleusine coracana subsp. coracana]
MDRLNTRNMLRRRNYKLEESNYNCVLCQQHVEETAFHLFFACPFSQQCWTNISIAWDMNTDFFTMLARAKMAAQHQYFMEIFIIATWQIWKQRNDYIFNRNRPSFHTWKRNFLTEAELQAHRLPEGKKQAFLALIELYR